MSLKSYRSGSLLTFSMKINFAKFKTHKMSFLNARGLKLGNFNFFLTCFFHFWYFESQLAHYFMKRRSLCKTIYLLCDSRMHSTLQECNRHIHQERYQPDPGTAKGGTFSQSDSKINGRRQKRT